MTARKPDRQICQSCMMVLKTPEDKGTEEDGTLSEDYCCDCYEAGEFTEPELTVKEMIELNVAPTAKSLNITMEEAKKYLESLIPTLKRWR